MFWSIPIEVAQTHSRSDKIGQLGVGFVRIRITITILRAIYLQGAKHPCQRDIIDIYWCFVAFYPCQDPCHGGAGSVTRDEGPTTDYKLWTVDCGP